MSAVEARTPKAVSTCTVYTVMSAREDAQAMRALHSADLVTPDGMPLVWLGRLWGSSEVSRVYGPDLFRAMAAEGAKRGHRHYLYGGAPETVERLAAVLAEQYPGLVIAGGVSPPFRPLTPEEDAEHIRAINAAAPDVLWVGLGSPKQDIWMAAHRAALDVPVMVGVGAAFDFLSGDKRQAPRWVQRAGLEWLYRLLQEPRRLARRYLLYNPLFVLMVAAQWIGRAWGRAKRSEENDPQV